MIRNILFTIFFFLGIILISLVFLPTLIMSPSTTLVGGKVMGHWAKYCLRIFLSVKINIVGKENIITNEKFFIACSHQSMFETFVLQTIFNAPVFILKERTFENSNFWTLFKKNWFNINKEK